MRTLASFPKAEQAHLLRARLESSGIAAYVRDEHLATIDWLYSGAIGGVKVDVSDEDFATATVLAKAAPEVSAKDPRIGIVFRPWHYTRVFLAVTLCVFIVLLVRNHASGGATTFTIPVTLGVCAGAIGAWAAILRDRAA